MIWYFSRLWLSVWTEWLLINWRHFNCLYSSFFNGLFAKQMCQIALLPSSIWSINGSVFAYAKEQCIDYHLKFFEFDLTEISETRNSMKSFFRKWALPHTRIEWHVQSGRQKHRWKGTVSCRSEYPHDDATRECWLHRRQSQRPVCPKIEWNRRLHWL